MATILLVDDMPANLALLAGLLEPHYRVRAVRDGVGAIRAALTHPRPDLIVLDVMMPEVDGYQVLRVLRDDPATADIPVIFVTALDDGEAEERGLALGAVDYVTKPIRPAITLQRIKVQLELKAARDWLRGKNAALEAEVRRRLEENVLIQDVSIRALAHLAEIRDPETGNHIRRTQGYVHALSRELSKHPRFADFLDDTNIELLAKSAPLHDIGKVGIPDRILLKAGRLDPDEWEVMKTHAVLGANAIEEAEKDTERPIDFLRIAKDIARHHHERWDGLGYPDQLGGDAIPIPARLMALADVFDALISQRVYKPPFPIEKSVEIIVGGRGSHFDPDIVDAFLARRHEFEAIATRYADSEEDVHTQLQRLSGRVSWRG